MRKQPLSYEEFKAIYSKVPRLCVDLIILVGDKVLLTVRSKDGWEGMWHIPGATLHLNERVVDAVLRVGQEELGKKVEIIKFLNYQEYPEENKTRGFGMAVSLVFLCKMDNAENLVFDEGTEKAELFDHVPNNIIPEQGEMLRKFLNFK